TFFGSLWTGSTNTGRVARSTDRQHRNDGRHSEPNRDAARPHSGRHEQIPPVLLDVSHDIPLPVSRRYDGRADEWEPDLTSVSVAGEGQKHAFRNLRKDVGIVGDQEDRRAIGRDGAESAVDVVFPAPEIAHAGDPDRSRRSSEADRGVLEHPNTGSSERG